MKATHHMPRIKLPFSRVVRQLRALPLWTLPFLALAPAPAHAGSGYINDGDTWLKLTPVERAAYIQGVNDTANFTFINDDAGTLVLKYARTRCMIDMKMTPNILADVVTTAYTKSPELKSQPPYFVYVTRLQDICRNTINQERLRLGLPTQ